MSVHHDHVRGWEAVYDELYAGSLGEDPDSRFAGWTSSYTGEPIPLAEMREWRDATVRRIRALRPKRVLEIGVGSGLLLTELAPRCDSYWGIDASGAAIDWLDDTLEDDLADRVVVRQCAAHELTELPEGFFDTVILNSVVQYFPGTGYLREVLDGVFRLLAPGGSVFVGDVRNPRSHRSFQAAIAVARGEQGAAALARADRALGMAEELLVDPGFFAGLPGTADIRLKEALHHNELSRHRYDVVLTRSHRDTPAAPELVWGNDLRSAAELRGRLDGTELVVRGIPNLRLTEEDAALAALESRPPPPPGVDPEELSALGAGLGYRVLATVSDMDGGWFDVLFTKDPESVAPFRER
ncbi:class I SAM-dependent methyltransferase [Amycolatopsis sp. CA-230715]|uniref:class I SAM-dependent methyltransferase n=1 Tax=Amycolatopsis sp. CA-230715 TaxID=2745196 RepID=UPI001C01F7A2|nr:class I SAM-dependent methyltransferase [Amycolatopsis sp. CA-230715]QWF82461.1 Chondramide synthase cmdD [Amycolatopsis sp. CA-230715]